MKTIPESEWHFGHHEKCRSYVLRKCYLSGKSLYLKNAIRIRYYDYSGMYEDYWVSEEMYLFLTLQYGNRETLRQE